MIRINLLGAPRPKRGKSPSMTMMPTEGVNPLVAAAVIFLITAIALGWSYKKVMSDQQKIANDTREAQAEAASLQQVKLKYEKRQSEAKEYEKRVKVIEQLRMNQSGPVDLLAMMGDTVSKSDAVWLNDMREEGTTKIRLDGTALSTTAVANFVTNMMKTGYFKNIEIEQTFQDPSEKEMSAFNFILVCEKQSKS
jgi:Tfp pilus assembly protein PilN